MEMPWLLPRGVYIEDIYSFAVNIINIVTECNENISIFMCKARVQI